MLEVEIGSVKASFARPVVAGTDLTGSLKLGDRIRIKGHTTEMELTVDSMEVENSLAEEASAGQAVGVKVSDRVRRGDKVYNVGD